MTRTTITSTVAALALVVAAPAAAAEISTQRTVAEAGDKAPVTVGGTGLKKGSTLKQGQTMIARKFTLEGPEKASLVLKCANGSVLQGAAGGDGEYTWVTASKSRYVGKRKVGIKLSGHAKPGEETLSAMYAVCRKA